MHIAAITAKAIAEVAIHSVLRRPHADSELTRLVNSVRCLGVLVSDIDRLELLVEKEIESVERTGVCRFEALNPRWVCTMRALHWKAAGLQVELEAPILWNGGAEGD